MLTKCIVVHLADDPRYRVRLDLGIDLARRFDAHLNVVYATPAAAAAPAATRGRSASFEFLSETAEVAHNKADSIRAEVESVCRAKLKSWEWHLEEGSVERIVSRFAHLSDLVIIEQAPLNFFEDRVIFHTADHLVISAGSPMLLVPETWQGTTVGTRVLIAWKNGREAIGAVRGALSFLQQAQQVLVLAAADERHVSPPGSDLVAYLSHHGVRGELIGASERGGEDILKVAKAQNCDLIVMGAYAHSRLREMFLGGATDHIMRHATVPVLMRH
jgi:nucleotide-binding universal stress UspA family protein